MTNCNPEDGISLFLPEFLFLMVFTTATDSKQRLDLCTRAQKV
ncbi:hypothetical protein LEMLEM_LOCUS2858 [Lemmus lemmus]